MADDTLFMVNSTAHDTLTGSAPDGQLAGAAPDMTRHGWTSDNSGRAMLGHHNRTGGGDRPTSWNSAHLSANCSAKGLDSTGGAGLFYCFAIAPPVAEAASAGAVIASAMSAHAVPLNEIH